MEPDRLDALVTTAGITLDILCMVFALFFFLSSIIAFGKDKNQDAIYLILAAIFMAMAI